MSQKNIRELLRKHPQGLTATSISNKLGVDRSTTAREIAAMPDKYIIGWVSPPRSPVCSVPVYAVALVPENAPRPD